MKIYLGSDHRGYSLKHKLVEYLSSRYEVFDLGNARLDPLDDYPDYADYVAKQVVRDSSSLGIVICGSGVGVCIVANKTKNAKCGLGFDVNQIKHARENDHINILALSSDYFDFEKNKALVDIFLSTQEKNDERFVRRINKIDTL